MIKQYTAAVIQAGSEMMDKDKGVDKAIRLIKEAGENEAKVIVFPEAQFDFDPVGHYARKDIFKLEVDETKRE
ncbi:nitrilase-related carbon-nitrogen hydrolase [Lentibacillus sp. CBA3610]|uniref:nitrilase-related carbon-nitrogen hydrolase n=1 Tax=Lentibacillus sp. CBA3610 TaxID=2518176 RepID=UPI00159534AA|nr:nitrilase-related carbon-nitrogen hydrolase [Lentibacillus sp. CBA3610]